MKTKKKDKRYMAILDRPIEELKKPMGNKVEFERIISKLLNGKNDCKSQ